MRPPTSKALLLIAYKFPPMHSISCNRTRAICQGMQKYVDSVHVLSTTNRHKLLQDNSQPVPENVTDAQTLDYRTIFQGKRKAAAAGEGYKTSHLGRFLIKLQHSFPFLYLFGEGNLLYILDGVRKASRIIARHGITQIISTFPPYADHLIAYRLKKANPGLTWIADFRDLHVDPAQDHVFARHHQSKINKKILGYADIVTTVSEGLALHLRKFHTNVQVLCNGLELRNLMHDEAQYPKFTISYSGSMFQDKRKPESVLQAVRSLIDEGLIDPQNVEFRYAGKDGAVWSPFVRQYDLSAVFTDHGLISRQDAQRILQKSHLNLLLTYSTPELKGNLTGKLADYLVAARPILVLINGPKDAEFEELIGKTKSGSVFYHGETEEIRAWILQLYREWQSHGQLRNATSDEVLSSLTWDAILEDFVMRNHLANMHTKTLHGS